MDELASVDLGLAGLPEAPAMPGRCAWLIVTRRAAMAGASLAAFAAVAFIGWRFFLAPEATLLGADSLPSPTQAVQGGVGSPQPSARRRRRRVASARVTRRQSNGGPDTTAPPSPSIGPPAPGQTPFPSVQPTSGARGERATRHHATADVRCQSLCAGDTAAPATTHTQGDAAPPPPPTPEPTPPPPPPTPEATPGGPLPECADLQDNDGDGFIDLLDLDCLDVFDLSESS